MYDKEFFDEGDSSENVYSGNREEQPEYSENVQKYIERNSISPFADNKQKRTFNFFGIFSKKEVKPQKLGKVEEIIGTSSTNIKVLSPTLWRNGRQAEFSYDFWKESKDALSKEVRKKYRAMSQQERNAYSHALREGKCRYC